MPLKKRYKRNRLWIDAELQLGLFKEFLVVLGMGAVLAVANIYMVSIFRDLYEAGGSSGAWTDSTLVWGYTIAMGGASVGMVFVVSAFYSHRVAGPAMKLFNHLIKMADGHLSEAVRLREKDHLASLADAINALGSSWNGTLSEVRNISDNLTELAQATKDDQLRQCAARLSDCINRASGGHASEDDQAEAGHRTHKLTASRLPGDHTRAEYLSAHNASHGASG